MRVGLEDLVMLAVAALVWSQEPGDGRRRDPLYIRHVPLPSLEPLSNPLTTSRARHVAIP